MSCRWRSEQFADVFSQSVGQSRKNQHRGIAKRTLDLANVGAIQIGLMAQALLGERALFPDCLDVGREMPSERLKVALLHILKRGDTETLSPRDIIYILIFCELKMLLTHDQWAESNPAKRKLSAPHRPWRCVGLSAESPVFLVDLQCRTHNPDQAIRSVLVSSPEELVEIVSEIGSARCRVFHLGLADSNAEEQPALTEMRALRSHREPDSPVKWYFYVDAQGHQHSCLPWSPAAAETSVWQEELVFDVITM
jgi:hypothetical protein